MVKSFSQFAIPHSSHLSNKTENVPVITRVSYTRCPSLLSTIVEDIGGQMIQLKTEVYT